MTLEVFIILSVYFLYSFFSMRWRSVPEQNVPKQFAIPQIGDLFFWVRLGQIWLGQIGIPKVRYSVKKKRDSWIFFD